MLPGKLIGEVVNQVGDKTGFYETDAMKRRKAELSRLKVEEESIRLDNSTKRQQQAWLKEYSENLKKQNEIQLKEAERTQLIRKHTATGLELGVNGDMKNAVKNWNGLFQYDSFKKFAAASTAMENLSSFESYEPGNKSHENMIKSRIEQMAGMSWDEMDSLKREKLFETLASNKFFFGVDAGGNRRLLDIDGVAMLTDYRNQLGNVKADRLKESIENQRLLLEEGRLKKILGIEEKEDDKKDGDKKESEFEKKIRQSGELFGIGSKEHINTAKAQFGIADKDPEKLSEAEKRKLGILDLIEANPDMDPKLANRLMLFAYTGVDLGKPIEPKEQKENKPTADTIAEEGFSEIKSSTGVLPALDSNDSTSVKDFINFHEQRNKDFENLTSEQRGAILKIRRDSKLDGNYAAKAQEEVNEINSALKDLVLTTKPETFSEDLRTQTGWYDFVTIQAGSLFDTYQDEEVAAMQGVMTSIANSLINNGAKSTVLEKFAKGETQWTEQVAPILIELRKHVRSNIKKMVQQGGGIKYALLEPSTFNSVKEAAGLLQFLNTTIEGYLGRERTDNNDQEEVQEGSNSYFKRPATAK